MTVNKKGVWERSSMRLLLHGVCTRGTEDKLSFFLHSWKDERAYSILALQFIFPAGLHRLSMIYYPFVYPRHRKQ